MKKILTRSGLAVATVAIVLAGAAAFSAYEAHIVNVTATIDNATNISTEALAFGQVFPQEILHQPVTLALSQSFTQSGALGVDYVIKQKPKCLVKPQPAGQTGLPTYAPVTENTDGTFLCPDGYDMMPLLCPFLSKTSDVNTDTSVPAFHGPLTGWTDTTSIQTQAVGHLTQANPSTTWDIDLHVPCFKGECAQDWATYVHTANPNATSTDYMLDPNLRTKALGCDLWYELTSVSRAPTGPKIGAVMTAYVAPTTGQCNATVSGSQSVQAAINNASADQTICVDPSYDGTGDNAPIVINKDNLTLAGLGSAGSANLHRGVFINNNGGKVTGLTLGLSTALSETFSVYVNSNVSNAVVSYNQATGSGSPSRGVINALGTTSNLLVSNNTFTGFATGVYLNNSSNMTVDHNTLTGNTVGLSADHPNGTMVTNNIIKNNTFEGVGTLVAAGDSIQIHNNNIYNNNTSPVSNLDNYDNTGTVDATNNWWGGATAVGINVQGVSSGTVNTAPVAVTAFPE